MLSLSSNKLFVRISYLQIKLREILFISRQPLHPSDIIFLHRGSFVRKIINY